MPIEMLEAIPVLRIFSVRELGAKDYKYLRPELEKTFYGSKCVTVIDPFGNKFRFNEELPADERPA